ncbi:MAG: hypothetical protein ACI4JM_07490 [Oscillospiraceae bacterium]
MNNALPYSCSKLTANIFYNLLLNAMINRLQPGDNYNGKTNKFSQTHLFYDLNILTDTSYSYSDIGNFETLYYHDKLNGSIKNAASDFKSGKFKKQKSNICNFNDSEIVSLFSEQVKNNYPKVLDTATEFSHRYFDSKESSKNKILIQKTIYLILNDTDIKETQVFYICSDGSTKTKAELRNLNNIEFEPFILGVWHYLISSQRLQEPINKNFTVSNECRKINIKITYINTNYWNINTRTNIPEEHSTQCKQNKNINKTKDLKQIHRISKQTQKINCSDNKCSIPSICSEQMSFYPSEIDEHTDIISILKDNDITLSRGIFFYLLTNNIEPIHYKMNKNATEKLFLAILDIIVDNNCKIDFSKSLAQYFHNNFNYLKKISSADWLDDKTQIDMFSNTFWNNYEDMLRSMIEISKKYFNSAKKNEALVVELIEFIQNDNSIEDNQPFYVCSDGSYLTKKQLCNIEELEFEPFLLGIWYYVITQLDYKDANDKYTYDTVFKLSYQYNGKYCERYRLSDIINEQSDKYVILSYLDA